MANAWSLDFCMVCDKQTLGGPYCSQACRLSDMDKCPQLEASSAASAPSSCASSACPSPQVRPQSGPAGPATTTTTTTTTMSVSGAALADELSLDDGCAHPAAAKRARSPSPLPLDSYESFVRYISPSSVAAAAAAATAAAAAAGTTTSSSTPSTTSPSSSPSAGDAGRTAALTPPLPRDVQVELNNYSGLFERSRAQYRRRSYLGIA
ncbi:hypothetical protein KEM52_002115 [Ascosphaera acerosa]|nr:hypothetical protein KEM52_002115 [Ascosphaera acerosa]